MAIEDLQKVAKEGSGVFINDKDNQRTIWAMKKTIEALVKEVERLDGEVKSLKGS